MSDTDPVQRVLDRLSGVKQTSECQWQARCPAHDDAHASLCIGKGKDGSALVKCQAGCPTDDVVSKIGLRMADLFQGEATAKPATPSPTAQITATYNYCNSAGVLLFQTVRLKPKDFKQRRPDGRGGWVWNLMYWFSLNWAQAQFG